MSDGKILVAKSRDFPIKARAKPDILIAKGEIDPRIDCPEPHDGREPGFTPRGGCQPLLIAKEE